MKPLSLALSIEWDDCTVALAGNSLPAPHAPSGIALSARMLMNAQGGPQASRDALALVQMALERAGQPLSAVERFCVNIGPGAFTSLRIAVGLVQGLALPRQRPVHAVGSLPALAATVPAWRFPLEGTPAGADSGDSPSARSATEDSVHPWLLCTALDARMQECYWAAFLCRASHWPEPVLAPAVSRAEEAAQAFETLSRRLQAEDRISAVHLAGNGFGSGFEALRAWALEAGQDADLAASRRPTAEALLAVADATGAPPPVAARDVRPLYVRDRVALDRDEQRQLAAARAARQGGA